jgi:hypothetical protein
MFLSGALEHRSIGLGPPKDEATRRDGAPRGKTGIQQWRRGIDIGAVPSVGSNDLASMAVVRE